MSFLEVEFPRAIGFHRIGSPSGFFTTVNEAYSGQEQRNKNWGSSRGKWTVSVTTPSDSQRGTSQEDFVQVLLAFHLNVAGKGDAFRLKDHIDHKFVNQSIGIGTGPPMVLQLTKSYLIGGRTYVRNVTKPIAPPATDYLGAPLANTVQIYFNGVLQVPGTGYTLDATTGLVSCTPPSGYLVTASGEFHYPVRFDVDELPMRIEESNVLGGKPIVTIDACPLVEVLPPNY